MLTDRVLCLAVALIVFCFVLLCFSNVGTQVVL